jgi:4-amino-4-deoxy-L-arabinose transferase-like glycosyltransferase
VEPAASSPVYRSVPAWAWAAIALALGYAYLRGAASDPLRWEEPRRALVAAEMIHRGDYVVARLLGEPYLNKPPLQSWLIVLLAGGRSSAVGALPVRLPSLLATLGVALLLFRLGLSGRSGPHPLPALVFLTIGVVAQYGRTGEMDLPFVFFVAAALAAFEAGRRRGSPVLQWLVSHALVAGGILTKGIAPLFFHPPALAACWRRQARWHGPALAAGVASMLALVALWVVPYALSGPVLALGDRLGSEVAQRTAGEGSALVRHVARYPFVLLGALAPWSLAVLALALPRGRALLRSLLADDWLALCGTVVLWGVVVFAFVPGTLPRYLLPVVPCAATLLAAAVARVDRPASAGWPWLALAVAWLPGVAVAHARTGLPAVELAATAAAGLLAIAGCAALARRAGALAAALACAGLLYGVFYAGVPERLAAARHAAHVAAAEALAARVRPNVPLVVSEGTDRRFTWPLAHALDRVLVERAPAPPYDLVGPADTPLPERSRFMLESGGYALWRVREPARP